MEKPKFDEVFTEKINTTLKYLDEKADDYEKNLCNYESSPLPHNKITLFVISQEFDRFCVDYGMMEGVYTVFQSFTGSIMNNFEFDSTYKRIEEIKSRYADQSNRFNRIKQNKQD